MFKSRIAWIAFMLLWMGILSMQAYNLGYSNAEWHYQDREWSLRTKHTDDLEEVYKKVMKQNEELEELRKKLAPPKEAK